MYMKFLVNIVGRICEMSIISYDYRGIYGFLIVSFLELNSCFREVINWRCFIGDLKFVIFNFFFKKVIFDILICKIFFF